MWLTDLLALLILCYWAVKLWDLRRYGATVRRLDGRGRNPADDGGGPDAAPPLVSVVLAAKEEESSIEETVKHLLSQDYPRLEIIAVNDRSADRTGARLDELKRWAGRSKDLPIPLTVVHITSLPSGWLGKNHALYQGYREARGQLILFTDADVRFRSDTISAAVRYLREERADHVTAAPAMLARGFWLRLFVHYFLFSLCLFTKPWRAGDDRTRKYGVGIGAFNLLTRRAYEAIGTHRAIALRPDDDLQLGVRVKRAGFRQRLVTAKNHLEVEWYPDLRRAMQGLEKNFFSGFRYRVWLASAALAGQLLLFLYPFVGVWFSGGWASAALGASVAVMTTMYVSTVRALSRYSGREVFALPLAVLLLAYVLVRSVALALKRGGVYWRGTFYSLSELKKMN